ncbi:MAG: elongation factor P [bacterium]
MADYTASDFRKGLRVELDNIPYVISEFNFVKPGKGAAIYTCRLKSLIDGNTYVRNFRSNDVLKKPDLEERTMRYSHVETDHYIFMDENYEQFTLTVDVLGNNRFFLFEDCEVRVLYHNGRPVDITLPTFVEKEVLDTEPGARGNTATNVLKPAKINGGFEIPVPLFVSQGDIIKIDTRTGEYADRVLKK